MVQWMQNVPKGSHCIDIWEVLTMSRTITVKGCGKASAKPDYVILSMALESSHRDYDRAMQIAADQIQQLNDTLCSIGFEKDSLKTTDFNVRTDYERIKDRSGNYKSVFAGYEVTHRLKLAFDFEMDRLAKALSAIAGCPAHPELSIAFTVKDASAINEEMLRSAAVNARAKAEILCAASGVALGDLIAIDYNWGELNIYSRTRLECCEEPAPMIDAAPIDIDPDDIDVSDTATFVWEIK